MAIVDVPPFAYPTPFTEGNSPIRWITSLSLTAVGNYAGTAFEAPATGDITGMGFYTRGVTTGDDVDCRLETLSTSTGLPSGTLAGTNTNVTQTIDSADDNTWFDVTFTSAYSATIGDKLCALISAPSGFAGNMVLGAIDRFGEATKRFPYNVLSGSINSGDYQVLAINYGGTYYSIRNMFPINDLGSEVFSSSDTPDEIGIYFQVPFGCRVSGFWIRADIDNEVDIVLYDSDGSTVLQSMSLDPDVRPSSGQNDEWHYFSGRSTLSANTNYRLTFKPTTTSNARIDYIDAHANAKLGQLPGGINWYGTERTDGGSWTESNTRVYPLGLVIDGIETGSGGGGVSGPTALAELGRGGVLIS